ncbi:hypothetical protein JR064_19825 [Xanthomonas sp. CFBP 8703]|uniref:Lipoprotein n=1 Tax=Xanthomonas bonasiae TaxID=2810351 RepID=A0ABS3B7V1_9XANT|nr:hypothetical protein [Xanthomonas bonasiae]MBN6104418.1 hypothetical protein [Xanthomonas bonasiae]
MKQIHIASTILITALALAGCNKEGAPTSAGEINLAGCAVPAGLSRAEAEKVQCAKQEQVVAGAKPAEAASTVPVAPAVPDEEVIAAMITEQAVKDGGASEYKDARKSAVEDLTGDGRPEVVVLYTLEGAGGGNGHTTYLAVFSREAERLKLMDNQPVGGFGNAIQGMDVRDGMVRLKVLVQGPNDPDCCPSTEEEAAYVVHNGKWIQVQPRS